MTNRWDSSVDCRVKVIDSFHSTSAWASATLRVTQPAVTVAFSPATVTQSVASVVSAAVTNATGPVTYQWQKNEGSGWTNVANAAAAITNVWGATVDYRARSVDANSVTSEWSAAATLTVLPSAISASLSFSPTSVRRGEESVLTATPTAGTAPYTYIYQWRLAAGTDAWTAASSPAAALTNRWNASVEYQVKAIDSFNSTSAWSAAATLTVAQASVNLAFAPTQVVHGVSSVLSATVSNAIAPYTFIYETRAKGATNWNSSPLAAAVTTNEWLSSVEYRACVVVDNFYTSQWSNVSTLTVVAPTLRVSLALSTNEIAFGTLVVATATPTNGTGPYAFEYRSRDITSTNQPWVTESGLTAAVVSNYWFNHLFLQVRVRDLATTNLSYWSDSAVLLVWPEMEPVQSASLPIVGFSVQPRATVAGTLRAESSGETNVDLISISWIGSGGNEYAISYAESLTAGWTEYSVRFAGQNDGLTTGTIPWDKSLPMGFFRIREYPLSP